MANGVSFIQYMRAHGNTPGPTQRPFLTGAVSGFLAEIPAIVILWWSSALESVQATLRVELWLLLVLHSAATVICGALYGRIFSRAANDPRGGWLFGISYGFLLWMVGPVTALQLTLGRPLALGVAAIGILMAHIAYGLTLGLTYPWTHRLLRAKLHKAKPLTREKGVFGIKTESAMIQGSSKV